MLGVNDMLNKILIPIQYANKILKQICTGNIMERVELELKGGTER